MTKKQKSNQQKPSFNKAADGNKTKSIQKHKNSQTQSDHMQNGILNISNLQENTKNPTTRAKQSKKQPSCYARINEANQKVPCPYRISSCQPDYTGTTSLRRHIQTQHKDKPPLQTIYNRSNRGRREGRPNVNPTQSQKVILYYWADFEEVFYKVVEQQTRKLNGTKGKIKKNDLAIYEDLLKPEQMHQSLQMAFLKLQLEKSTNRLPLDIQKFRENCLSLMLNFIEHLNSQYSYKDPKGNSEQKITLNSQEDSERDFQTDSQVNFSSEIQEDFQQLYSEAWLNQQFPDPLSFGSKQSSLQKDKVRENNLMDLIQLGCTENNFETQLETEQQQYFRDNFFPELSSRLKKDLVLIVWASGVVRRDLFIEWLQLVLSVMEWEYLDIAERRVQMKANEYDREIERIVKGGTGVDRSAFKKLDDNFRRELLGLRRDFHMEQIREKNEKQRKYKARNNKKQIKKDKK